MTAGFIRAVAFLALAGLAVLVAFGRGSQTQATSPSATAYEYKVELVKHKKDLEGRLKEDGRNGWRVQSVLATPSDNELVVVLEKAASTP